MSRIHLRAESAARPYSAGTGLCGGEAFGSAGTVEVRSGRSAIRMSAIRPIARNIHAARNTQRNTKATSVPPAALTLVTSDTARPPRSGATHEHDPRKRLPRT